MIVFFEVTILYDCQRFLARVRGDLATEFSPPAQNEVRKKKRTTYRKTSAEF